MPIVILDRDTSEKIAAGEVVERPLSVVKELVENAIDAGSTSLAVDLEDGGSSVIRVIDDGCGMTRDELELAVCRFATSKIRSFDDLEQLATLGFRGEALPSIAAVSTMAITSRPHDAEYGHRIVLEGGHRKSLKEAAAEKGTFIEVSQLFFNTPARKKFQKSPSQETAQITHFLSRMALAYRNLHFTLSANKKSVFNFPPAASERERLMELWRLKDGEDLQEVCFEKRSLIIRGFFCSPSHTKANRLEIITFVNGRLIKSPLLNQAIQEGYNPFIPDRKFPQALLFLEIPGSEIDVNVHPSKVEIRFASSSQVFREVRDVVAGTVRKFSTAVPNVSSPFSLPLQPSHIQSRGYPSFNPRTGEVRESEEMNLPGFSPTGNDYLPASAPDSIGYMAKSEPHGDGGERDRFFFPLSQIFNTYIVGEMNGELIIVDQHAAHERITYERLIQREAQSSTSLQGLLFSEVLELSEMESTMLLERLPLFAAYGVELEHFGGNSFRIRAIPSFINEKDAGEFIREVLADLLEGREREGGGMNENLRKLMACHGSIQAGQRLTPEEMTALMSSLLTCNDPLHCPHGRPTMARFGKAELEKLFKRRI